MKSIKKSSVWMPLIIAASLCAGIFLGIFLTRTVAPSAGEKKLASILDLIADDYVEAVDLDSLIEQTLPDLLANLDPHTVYIPASALADVNADIDGSFSGIGISFTMFTDTVTVNEVIPGGPSEKAGLMPGDRIVTVNDSLVAGRNISQTDIMGMLRGEKGTQVRLGIERKTAKKRLSFEVTRGDIPVNTVVSSYIVEPGVGYIKLRQFGRTSYNEFITALALLRNAGAEKYIIDLRGNVGGLLDMPVLMANEFLPAGSTILVTRGRNKQDNTILHADGSGSFIDTEVAVLLDEYSASASEIFAGALQDNDRGLIVGRRSFGKGLVQRQITLPDSSAVRLTVSRYYTPSGRCIQKDYSKGKRNEYDHELIDRYDRGELFESDSMKINLGLEYLTLGGRKVYGGGGIMPDIFVPNDTTGITSYYINVFNAGLMQRYAFDYSDRNRDQLSRATNVDELMRLLPSDDELLQGFVYYASTRGVPARWYYINISGRLIVNFLKALIANDILGNEYSYQVTNTQDTTIGRALQALRNGDAALPITLTKEQAAVMPVKPRQVASAPKTPADSTATQAADSTATKAHAQPDSTKVNHE